MIPLVTVDTVYIATVATIINDCNGVLYIGNLKGVITMEELKKAIIDMVNGLDNERWTRCIYFYVRAVTAHVKGGEKHEGNRQEDMPAAL